MLHFEQLDSHGYDRALSQNLTVGLFVFAAGHEMWLKHQVQIMGSTKEIIQID